MFSNRKKNERENNRLKMRRREFFMLTQSNLEPRSNRMKK